MQQNLPLISLGGVLTLKYVLTFKNANISFVLAFLMGHRGR